MGSMICKYKEWRAAENRTQRKNHFSKTSNFLFNENHRGKEFDRYGNYRNWWDNMTNIRFRHKTQCIIDQYNKYKLKNGLKVNGVLTQGENIADNGGAKEAFKVF